MLRNEVVDLISIVSYTDLKALCSFMDTLYRMLYVFYVPALRTFLHFVAINPCALWSTCSTHILRCTGR